MGDLSWRRILPLALLVYVLVTGSSLFVPLIVNAAKYAQISREILESGDWINLRIAGDAYDQKPPLLFWLGALAYTLFGMSPVVYKLSVILASLAGLFATFRLGEILYGRTTGLLAALFLATTLGHLHFHNDIHTDTLLADFVVLATWQLVVFFERGRKVSFFFGLIFIGLAMLTKGPVGIAIPAFAIGSHLLLKRKFNEIFHPRWLMAIPVVGMIILPALWGLLNQFGMKGIIFYFWTNNAGRITGSYQGHGGDPFFSLHTSAYMLFPWTIFAFSGLIIQIRKKIARWEKPDKNDEYYTLGGILIFLAILTVSRTQMPHYLLSVLPFFAILASHQAIRFFGNPEKKRFTRFVGYGNLFLSFLFLSVIPLFGFWFYPEKRIWVWLVIVAGIVAGSWIFVKRKGLEKNISFLLLTTGLVVFYVNISVLPNMATYHSPLKAVQYFNRESATGQRLHMFSPQARYWSLIYYSKNPGYYMPDTGNFRKRKIPTGDWVYTDDVGLTQLKSINVRYKLRNTFIHRSITSQSFKFLNPVTRAKYLQKRFLIQLQ
ncbi:MAG: glycosyltransferase family 39 protein [Prolixibacteraceae bacterium]|jgi:4-amino-4-deoxy-L-arabinose transferase-like glycosyltransferase|nr:glycosyltransferase family 39 protein [Prolixibacteraceae bacterium]